MFNSVPEERALCKKRDIEPEDIYSVIKII